MSARHRKLRSEAHEYFDKAWRFGAMSRDEAYTRLASHLGLTREQCHFSKMKPDHVQRALEFAKTFFAPIVASKMIHSKRERRHGKVAKVRGRHGAKRRREAIHQMRAHELERVDM